MAGYGSTFRFLSCSLCSQKPYPYLERRQGIRVDGHERTLPRNIIDYEIQTTPKMHKHPPFDNSGKQLKLDMKIFLHRDCFKFMHFF